MANGGVFASFSNRMSLAADLDRAGADFGVHRLWRARLDVAEDRDHVLGPEAPGARDERLVVADDDLRHAVAIANVDEQKRAEIAKTVHPAEQYERPCRRRQP